MIENRVYKFGCRAPKEMDRALQLLGQAWLYREELRRIYNAAKRDFRTLLESKDDASHVMAFTHQTQNERIRGARRRRGHLLDAGTYWLIEAAMLSASKASRLDPIKMQHWDGTGSIGGEIHSRAQFPALDWTTSKRISLTSLNARRHAELTIHVGALAAGQTITWPIKLHRDFPDGAVVKQVAVQRTRSGHRFRWEALVTIEFEPDRKKDIGLGIVGVDVGWRRNGELGMLVATYDGEENGVVDVGSLHIDTIRAFQYSDSIRSIRDVNFDEAKRHVSEAQLPGAQHALRWKDKERMRRIALTTQDLGALWWRERDRHLEDIEAGVRDRAIRRRLDAYQRFADALARKYRYVALEDMPMQAWVGEGDTASLERWRSSAAIHILQTVILQRFGAARVDWLPSAFTTMTCSSCGLIRAEKVGPALRWKCECGAEHHQDENAARVLRYQSERWIGDGNPPRARTRKVSKRKEKKNADGIGTGDHLRMVATSREPELNAAE